MQEWIPSAEEISGLAKLLENSISSDSAVQATVVKVFFQFLYYSNWRLIMQFLIIIGI